MRTRTFVFSFLVHTAMLAAVMVVRIFATTELPDPPISTKFMMAVAETPEAPPPPPRVTQTTTPAVNQSAIPLVAPPSIAPKIPGDIPDTAPVSSVVGAGTFGDPVGDGVVGPPPPPRIVPPPAPQPIRPGGNIRPPQKVHNVAPAYPPIAQAARVSGTVILDALITEDGSVRDVKVLRSVALLDAAAIEAVRQWRFTPTLLNGIPVQVIMTVTVTFNLN